MTPMIKINRTIYAIEAEDSRDAIASRGLANAAALMANNGIAANLILRRPRGRVEYFAVRYEDGRVELRTRIL